MKSRGEHAAPTQQRIFGSWYLLGEESVFMKSTALFDLTILSEDYTSKIIYAAKIRLVVLKKKKQRHNYLDWITKVNFGEFREYG